MLVGDLGAPGDLVVLEGLSSTSRCVFALYLKTVGSRRQFRWHEAAS